MEDKVIVPIQACESEVVEKLFYKYNSFIRAMTFLMKNTNLDETTSKFLNDKFEECITIDYDLEHEKEKLNLKYNPDINHYHNYLFDFTNKEMVFEV